MISELEVQTSHKDLGLWVFVNDLLWLLLGVLSSRVFILLLHYDVWVRFIHMHQGICWLHGVELWLLLHRIESLLHATHLSTEVWILLSHLSHCVLTLWLDIVVCALYINSLLIYKVALISIGVDGNKFDLVFLCFLFVFKLHFDEAKSSASTGSPISHYDSIRYDSKFLEVFNKIRFYKTE